eukprot:scaffold6273_cov376-Prasinococcus_capsulatus_cf.AAC.7
MASSAAASVASARLTAPACTQSLDTAIDSEAPLAIFDDTNRLRWPVSRKHAAWGVYVVPPFGTSVSDWEADQLPSV